MAKKPTKEEKAAQRVEKKKEEIAAALLPARETAVKNRAAFAAGRLQKQAEGKAAVTALHGAGYIASATETTFEDAPRISSGIFMMDVCLNGGWPAGRICIVWGNWSTMKTTNMLRMIANAQKTDIVTGKPAWMLPEGEVPIPYRCGFVDVENSFDRGWAERQGVDLDTLDIINPKNTEDVGDVVYKLLKEESLDIIVIDSLAAMIPEALEEAEMGERNIGLSAQMNEKLLRKIQAAQRSVARRKGFVPSIFIINQMREKIGIVYGAKETKPGGVAQNYYASVDVFLTASVVEFYDPKERQFPKTQEFGFKVLKNKCGTAKMQAKYVMQLVDDPSGSPMAGQILELKEVLAYAKRLGVYSEDEKKGYKVFDRTFRIQKEVVDFYENNPTEFAILKSKLVDLVIGKTEQSA